MNILNKLLHALWQQNFEMLADPNLVWMIYLLVFVILFLENGILPAAFLPGDSLLILMGILIAKGVLNFLVTLLILTIASSLGGWTGYLQGKWLENNRFVKTWLMYLPARYKQRAYLMFHQYGLSALLVGRFIAFLRTLMPTIAGLSGMNNLNFHFFNLVSALFWTLILMLIGFILGRAPVFQYYEKELILCLILLPLVLLALGLLSSLIVVWRRKRWTHNDKL